MISVVENAAAIQHQGLRYLWRRGAFLSREEARYGMERLWALCAGYASWSGERRLDIPAIGRRDIEMMHRHAPGELPWIRLDHVVPGGDGLTLDTASLPSLCPAPEHSKAPAFPCGPFPLDLVAATFLMLTRWEEEVAGPGSRDEWDCYRAGCSLASRQGFLDRPVLDEWAIVLRTWLSALQPSWRARPRGADIWMTHDIDHVRDFPSWHRVVRRTAGTLLRTRSIAAAFRAASRAARGRLNPSCDPSQQGVRELLALDESLGLRGTFFFMTADAGRFDDGYALTTPDAASVIAEVQRRGHEVAWHPGYRAGADAASLSREKERLDRFLGKPVRGARHHYLRCRPKTTWARLANAQLEYDSTLGHNEAPGFRCGTSHPFPVWDPASRRAFPLEERPLIIQDVAVVQDDRADADKVCDLVRLFWRRVRRVGGTLTVSIHNTQARSRELAEVIRAFAAALQ